MKSKLLFVLIVPLLVVSCNNTPITPKDPYTTKTINAKYINRQYNTTATLRYYNESVIPYISLKEYQSLLYRGRTYQEGRDRFEMVKNGDTYTYTVAGDYTATFDVKGNKMESDNLWGFKNTNLVGIGDVALVSGDGLPFTRVKTVTYSKAPKKTVIDFNKYNMKIYGDINDVYVPVTFATDLFTNENMLQGSFNNKDLFFVDGTALEDLDNFGSDYYNNMYKAEFTQEYADFVYNELCLSYDNFLGRPGRSSLEVYYDLSGGLDNALESRPLGRTIKSYLKSTDLGTFLAGAKTLGYLRQDGGHSGYDPSQTYYYDPIRGYSVPSWLTSSRAQKATNLFMAEYEKGYEELVNFDQQFYHTTEVRKARNVQLGKTNGYIKGVDTYTKDGDIAYIHIDGFMNEIYLQEEWNKYYNGQRDTIPFGNNIGGAVGAIQYGVTQAANDDEVKHVVIDLAANGGGSTDEMLFMIALLTGSKNFYTYNTMTEQYITATYEFDFNFDKVFDKKDDEMLGLLNNKDISVLTTRNGFSCGGISPIYLHDEGLFTIGEECGGGSCSVYNQYDGYGNFVRASSPSHTVTKEGVSIDIARKTVCDYKLTFPTTTTGYVYSSLYNTSTLRTIIENHYK